MNLQVLPQLRSGPRTVSGFVQCSGAHLARSACQKQTVSPAATRVQPSWNSFSRTRLWLQLPPMALGRRGRPDVCQGRRERQLRGRWHDLPRSEGADRYGPERAELAVLDEMRDERGPKSAAFPFCPSRRSTQELRRHRHPPCRPRHARLRRRYVRWCGSQSHSSAPT